MHVLFASGSEKLTPVMGDRPRVPRPGSDLLKEIHKAPAGATNARGIDNLI